MVLLDLVTHPSLRLAVKHGKDRPAKLSAACAIDEEVDSIICASHVE
jgi:hypothetical protein